MAIEIQWHIVILVGAILSLLLLLFGIFMLLVVVTARRKKPLEDRIADRVAERIKVHSPSDYHAALVAVRTLVEDVDVKTAKLKKVEEDAR